VQFNLFIKDVIEIIRENVTQPNRNFIIPPPKSNYGEFIVYSSKTDVKIQDSRMLPVDKIIEAEKDFGMHIASNLQLKYTSAASTIDQTVLLRSLLSNLGFMSPLEVYSRREDLKDVDKIKSDWLIGVFKQTNEIIFLYLNFTIPKIKAIFRAGLQLDFDFGNVENIRVKSFLSNFNNFLSYLSKLKETDDFDWAKITAINMHQIIIIKSSKDIISEKIIQL
jgi:hypothetical protein